jgi:hypothetical protein
LMDGKKGVLRACAASGVHGQRERGGTRAGTCPWMEGGTLIPVCGVHFGLWEAGERGAWCPPRRRASRCFVALRSGGASAAWACERARSWFRGRPKNVGRTLAFTHDLLPAHARISLSAHTAINGFAPGRAGRRPHFEMRHDQGCPRDCIARRIRDTLAGANLLRWRRGGRARSRCCCGSQSPHAVARRGAHGATERSHTAGASAALLPWPWSTRSRRMQRAMRG